MIRVYVWAASAVVRAGLETVLRADPDMEVTGADEDADLILADWPRAGEDLPQELLDLAPAAVLVVLADDPQHAWTAEILRSGVRGVLPRDAPPNQIVAAVKAAGAGLVILPAEDVETVLATPRPARKLDPLSPREVEVLGMLAEGHSNKAIAYRLGISEHTVKFHIASIMSKLNAGSRTEAVTLGIRQGLILL